MAGRGSPRPARSAQEANDETRPFLSLTFLIFTGSSQTGASRRHVCQGCYEPPSATSPICALGPPTLALGPRDSVAANFGRFGRTSHHP
jgi:hypothetical protein